jgi:tRNA dimethylallyltransferase
MKSEGKPLIVILGPTAVGKSSLAIPLAQRWNTEIVSVDALQVYKYMDIGTAKPSLLEQSLVPHHMIDIVYPDEDYNAGRYEKEAGQVIDLILRARKIPLLAGGCGLYLKALLHGLFQGPQIDPDLRKQLRQESAQKGDRFLYETVNRIDPQAAQRIHPNDRGRLIRAIEVYLQTGIPISAYQKEHSFQQLRYRAKIIGLTRIRNDLYSRIEKRVDEMIEKGLVEEVRKLLESGYSQNSTALQGLGYRQIASCLQGKYSLEEAIRILKRETRHYAKRQFTWFRKLDKVHWIDLTSYSSEEDIMKECQRVTEDLFNQW